MEATPNPAGAEPQADPMAEALARIEAKIDEKLNAALGSVHKKIRTFEERMPAPAAPAASAEPDEKLTLKALQNQMRARDEQELREKKSSAIRESLRSHGLDDEGCEMLEAYVRAKSDDAIVARGDGVFWIDPANSENVKPVADYIKDVVKQKGDRFRPPVALPSGRGLRSGAQRADPAQSMYGSMSPEDRGKLSESQRNSLARTAWQKFQEGK